MADRIINLRRWLKTFNCSTVSRALTGMSRTHLPPEHAIKSLALRPGREGKQSQLPGTGGSAVQLLSKSELLQQVKPSALCRQRNAKRSSRDEWID
jgi:hypothetical protein